jgi:hypothetical protein
VTLGRIIEIIAIWGKWYSTSILPLDMATEGEFGLTIRAPKPKPV